MNKIAFEDFSIRARISVCIVASFAILISCFFLSLKLNRDFLERIGSSYKTNAELTEISTNISNTEEAFELYMKYRSFESIDSYYHFFSVSEASIENLHDSPSTDVILYREYVVRQLIKSFLEYSRNAVTAQRANDTLVVNNNLQKSLKCYVLLQKEIENLNTLFMRRNATDYLNSSENYLQLAKMSAILISVFFVLVLFFLYISVTIITKPLADISNIALRVAGMDFDVPLFNIQSNNEIGNICRAFDRMIVSIKEYIDKIWEKAATESQLKERELEMRELYADAQLRSLQNQINPHFLFNTLNTGAQLAMIEGADKTCYFIEQVADFFRYNIQQKDESSTIDEELALVDNFVYIMKVRFGDRLEFQKNIQYSSHPQKLPRMILQPLVENCIKYSLSETKGKVTLTLERDEFFTKITVSDTGCGFPQELKEKLLSANPSTAVPGADSYKNKNGNGMGLMNVISRLKLYFHSNDVFDILINEDGGTTFLVRIPNNV